MAKKNNIKLESAILYIRTNFSNVIMSLTNKSGDVLTQVSAGTCGFINSKKSTPQHAFPQAMKKMIERMLTYQIKTLDIFVKGPGVARDLILNLVGTEISVLSITDRTSIPHNGCRPRKARRV